MSDAANLGGPPMTRINVFLPVNNDEECMGFQATVNELSALFIVFTIFTGEEWPPAHLSRYHFDPDAREVLQERVALITIDLRVKRSDRLHRASLNRIKKIIEDEYRRMQAVVPEVWFSTSQLFKPA